ncbi:DEAD/DEAH box helicase family protein [Azospirillum sp. HJ39]|uniref:EcoAI/FtnUII family type I restriction enzme subunit R n=1 Tax=Azospirillum sp. HJ39 TaxID=3159496 RepID=UPI00355694C9
MSTEADTCRKFVVPKLQAVGWDDDPHAINEQRSITDGRIIPRGSGFVRKPPKRPDYILKYTRDFPIAVVEAKARHMVAAAGLGQAKQYAEMLGLKFAYATNGREIVEFDYTTGREAPVADFPTPEQLWARYRAAEGLADDTMAGRLLTPYRHSSGHDERYYQQIAINRVVERVLKGDRRLLLTMATGTGKTAVAFQICWKLWSAMWNRTGEHRKPKILFLADRNILVDQPKDGIFAVFGDARHKIGDGPLSFGREIYFGIYQALAEDERRDGLFRQFRPDFFDLIIVDECHRGSARDHSSWRRILEYFEPVVQLGLTATPLREDNRDTYAYFGDAIYEYSLRQGIEDGFLAPYRVHQVVSTVDATGWRPSRDELDRYGRRIPDEEYLTKDFDRTVALLARTEAIARHLTDFLKASNRTDKTIVFCVDQEHALEMRKALINLNSDMVRRNPDYVCRVTADDGAIGRTHLGRFKDVEPKPDAPIILTTSQLLTTGVDAPTCKNVVLARVVGSMSEFKQIIGRGTRVRHDYGKLWFNIIDYTGSAMRKFADPAFDGDPVAVTEETVDEEGTVVTVTGQPVAEPPEPDDTIHPGNPGILGGDNDAEPRKYYVDGGEVEIAVHVVHEMDPDGHRLRTISYTDYAAEKVRGLVPDVRELHRRWGDARERADIIEALAERGIDFAALAEEAGQPEADPFDLLCHLAFNAPLLTRRERAQRLKSRRKDFFDQYGPEARQILDELLEKYADHGAAQFKLPDILDVPPISTHGNKAEIVRLFGGPDKLREAVVQLQSLLYVA